MRRFLIPLGIFLALLIILAVGLRLDPREIPSPLLGKPAPAFELPRLNEPRIKFSPAKLMGKAWLLNVWASWCTACRQEHPVLAEFAKNGALPLYGLNYRDQPEDALRWLADMGDPYILSALDSNGRVAIDYGVYGVPETFLIDKAGIIRFRHIGPLTREVLQNKILPLLKESPP